MSVEPLPRKRRGGCPFTCRDKCLQPQQRRLWIEGATAARLVVIGERSIDARKIASFKCRLGGIECCETAIGSVADGALRRSGHHWLPFVRAIRCTAASSSTMAEGNIRPSANAFGSVALGARWCGNLGCGVCRRAG